MAFKILNSKPQNLLQYISDWVETWRIPRKGSVIVKNRHHVVITLLGLRHMTLNWQNSKQGPVSLEVNMFHWDETLTTA